MNESGSQEVAEQADRIASIIEAQADVRRLLRHSVGRVRVLVPTDLIADCVAVMWADPATLSAEQEAVLWKCLDRLTQAVRPATAASIEQVEEIEEFRRSHSGILRGFWSEPEGPRFIAWARGTMFGVLLLVIVGQIYTLSLSGLLSNLATYNQELQETKREISQLRQAKPDIEEKSEPLHSLMEKGETSKRRLEGGYQMLFRWSSPWRWFVTHIPTDTSPEREASTDSIIEEAAQAVLQALTLYLLPVLYGLLGAAAYILRRLNESLDEATFTIISTFRYRLRLALGALLGPTIGLFFAPETKVIPGASLSLVALAFLAGYSVEVVFALLDSVINRARDAFGSATKAQPPASQPGSVAAADRPGMTQPAEHTAASGALATGGVTASSDGAEVPNPAAT